LPRRRNRTYLNFPAGGTQTAQPLFLHITFGKAPDTRALSPGSQDPVEAIRSFSRAGRHAGFSCLQAGIMGPVRTGRRLPAGRSRPLSGAPQQKPQVRSRPRRKADRE